MLWYFAVVAYLLVGLPVARQSVINNNNSSTTLDSSDIGVFLGAWLVWPLVLVWWFFAGNKSIMLRLISKFTGVPMEEK